LPKTQGKLDSARSTETDAAAALWSLLGVFAGEAQTPEDALIVTARLDKLAGDLDEMQGKADRIAGIDRRCDEFIDEFNALRVLSPDLPADTPGDSARHLLTRLSETERAAEAQETHEGVRDRAAAESEEAAAQIAGLDEELRRLGEEVEITDSAALAAAADQALALAAVEANLTSVDTQLVEQAPGKSAIELVADAADRDIPSLDAEIAESRSSLDDLDTEIEAAAEVVRTLQEELQAMDGSERAAESAAEAERASSAAIEAGEECARLLLARFIADEAIRRFRESNQDPVLAGAGQYLSTVTGGAYRTIGVDAEGGGLQISARDAGGMDKEFEHLSTGLGDQLWFSLRLAAIEAAVKRAGPIPVVVDDVLVNFDDNRTLAALSALSELGKVTQVFLFTHHHEVAELARNELGAELAAVRTLDSELHISAVVYTKGTQTVIA
jgi:uncharacterized protein YhaN